VAGRLFDEKAYGAAFLLAAVFPVAGWAIWLGLNRERPVTLEGHVRR